LKLVLLLLIAANLALYAWQHGAFGPVTERGREPARIERQIEPERIRVLTPEQAHALREAARKAQAQAADSPLDAVLGAACVEFGDFSDAQAARLRPRLEALIAPERIEVRTVEAAGWYLVYLPPLRTRAEAERAAVRLREQGVRDFVVIGENSPLRHGIALGSFRDQEQAARHVSELHKRGVTAARVADRPSTVSAARFVIRAVDAPLAGALYEMKKEFNATRLHVCPAGA